MIAKVCSDKNKPNGQFVVPPSSEAILSFMNDLPIRKVCQFFMENFCYLAFFFLFFSLDDKTC